MKKRLLAMVLSVALVLAFMPVVALAGRDEGWDESHTHYWYYSEMVTDEMFKVIEDKGYYYFQHDGTVKKGWILHNGRYYYGDPDKGGKLALGWKKIRGYWYYFAPQYGNSENGNLYYEGEMYGDGPDKINGKWYYFGKSDNATKWGKLQYKWIKEKDEYGHVIWYYGDPDKDGQMAAGWKKIDGKWYYFEKELGDYYNYGTMYAGGVFKIDDHFYYLSDSGALKTGWIKETFSYTDADGDTFAYDIWYYGDPAKDSQLAEAWKKIDGKWYYFDDGSFCEMVANMTYEITGKTYAFNRNGSLHEKAGWVDLYEEWTDKNGKKQKESWWVYTDNKGIATIGWKKIGGYWYYFDLGGYMVSDDWASDSAGTCWMDSNGRITKDKWIKYEGNWYYLKANGYRAEDEWAKDSKGWLYMDETGRITVDEVITYKGNQYYVGDDGYMVVNKEFTVWYDGAFHDYRADKNGVLELINIYVH